MRRASSRKNRNQDRENFGDLRKFMEGQDEYSRLITSEEDEIQCKYDSYYMSHMSKLNDSFSFSTG